MAYKTLLISASAQLTALGNAAIRGRQLSVLSTWVKKLCQCRRRPRRTLAWAPSCPLQTHKKCTVELLLARLTCMHTHTHTRKVKQQEICYRAWMTYLAAGCGAAGSHLAGGHLWPPPAAPLLSPRSWRLHHVLPVCQLFAGRPRSEDEGWCGCRGARLHPLGPKSQESLYVCGITQRHKLRGNKPRGRERIEYLTERYDNVACFMWCWDGLHHFKRFFWNLSVTLSGLRRVRLDTHACTCTQKHLKLSERSPSQLFSSSWFWFSSSALSSSSSAYSSSLIASLQKGWPSNSGQRILGKTVQQ